jgi:hypothetical protein
MRNWFSILALSIFALFGAAFAQGPQSDVGSLFTPQIVQTLVFLLTMPLTTVLSTVLKLEGTTASLVCNVILNALAKGVVLVITVQATPLYAFVAFAIGVLTDKVVYDLLVKHKNEKIGTLEAKAQS